MKWTSHVKKTFWTAAKNNWRRTAHCKTVCVSNFGICCEEEMRVGQGSEPKPGDPLGKKILAVCGTITTFSPSQMIYQFVLQTVHACLSREGEKEVRRKQRERDWGFEKWLSGRQKKKRFGFVSHMFWRCLRLENLADLATTREQLEKGNVTSSHRENKDSRVEQQKVTYLLKKLIRK